MRELPKKYNKLSVNNFSNKRQSKRHMRKTVSDFKEFFHKLFVAVNIAKRFTCSLAEYHNYCNKYDKKDIFFVELLIYFLFSLLYDHKLLS